MYISKHGFFLMLSLAAAQAQALDSPDQRIGLKVELTPQQTLVYSITRDAKPVVLASSLGLQLAGADLTHALSLKPASKVRPVSDHYEMAVGKKRKISYRANEQVFPVQNAAGQTMDLIFRVSNDGVAFRYVVKGAEPARKQFISEATGFTFAPAATAWLQPMSVAQTGWSDTNPSYEEHYQREVAVGTPSLSKAGWVFPALFKSGDTWVALTEAGMDGSFHASRLQAKAPNASYRIGSPMDAEVYTGGKLLAESSADLVTPWRIIALGSLATLVESTLGTDLAAPAIAFDKAKVKPGHAAWSWALLKDDATVYDVQKKFIDYAADMHWDYALIDADWDRKIGYEKIKELAAYAATRKVGVLVWYNSSGAWNKTAYSPKGALLTREQRVREFARLKDMGIKGVKVDFFSGDGASMIGYYVGILKDAAAAGLLVNFHGATLPRGWARTYPNLMTAEAIRGLEFTTFEQKDQDLVARHVATIPFTRNLFDPMDYTPMVFGDIPKIRRVTRNGFELAESVLFLSGIQHFADTPEGMASAPAYVKALLQELPRSWDASKFIDGYPGTHAVIARQSGKAWYVAGLNADDTPRTVTMDLGFLGKRKGKLISDGKTEREFTESEISGGQAVVTIEPHGGFIAVFK
ncbi:glycoside hydrolase family 97 protein [Massilia pseudoviolaceinigra]|uniref:glycoside hydrolase family 97 protein n=1 Tax=Massilia pseudoviolaceinigra TaxID=3057165 RepID=UPI0027963FBD|nr:glycoside hydrolase family 97 protein [Massilia sp. CCM 9206]MDQ1923694.1 glycoside hydrolase family 97 catalytic domain-containing protein [Massilia sp. CCM 9206]